MTEMIDRCVDSVRSTVEFGSFWDENDARAIVKAVIQAMREPTNQMLEDAGTMPGYGCEDLQNSNPDEHHTEWWHAMIDAALSGKSGMGEG